MDNRYDVIVIGAGPGGMTASIYAKRAGLNVLLLENYIPGGKMVKTYDIQNYPSYNEINGADLSNNMFNQTQHLGVEYKYGDVSNIEDGEFKKVICKDGTIYESKAVIIATGTKERLLNVEGESNFLSKGISFCAVCDGAFFKNKIVTVIGGGNSALEESLYLANIVEKIYIVIRRDEFRAEKITQEKVLNNPKIEIIKNSVVTKIDGTATVENITIKNVLTNEETNLKTDGVFPYIGADPNTEFVKNLGITDEKGYVLVDEKMETSIKGIFSVGDCNKKDLRQIVTATSDGAIAGQNAYHYIKG